MDKKGIIGFSIAALTLAALPALAQELRGPGWLARETAGDYRARARFPESSRAVQPGEKDPVKEKRIPTKQRLRVPAESEPALTVWASAVSVEVGKHIDLFAELERTARPVLAVDMTAEIAGDAGEIVANVIYHDDGRTPDARAGDGVWSARLTLPAGLEPEGAASYMVRARARLLDGDLREAAGGFLYSNPGARLTGRYNDELREGSLVISAEVEVRESGRFHLAGTLYSMAGEPIGTAQAAAELTSGRHWIDLSFYGLIFHDRRVAGPYRLGTLALSTTTRMPNALNDLVENVYVTRPHRLEQLTNRPFNEPRLLDAAARLEAEAVRSISRQ